MSNAGTEGKNAVSLKARMFSSKNKMLRSKIIKFFGEDIEIRQPTIGHMIKQTENELTDPMERGLLVLMNFAFVPGTDERVFNDTDTESLAGLPYGEDFARAVEAFQMVTDTSVQAAEKN